MTLSSGSALFSLVFIDGGRLSGDVDGCSLDSAGEIRIDSKGWGGMRINSLYAQPLRLTQPSYVKHSTHPVKMAFFDLSLMIYIIYYLNLYQKIEKGL